MKNILYLVTARGGSKGVPKKNIREIDGLPLIAYKIIAAKRCKYPGRIIVSTDSEEIAEISRKYGADVPFMRPAELASDTASSIDVIYHAIDWVEKNDETKYDYLCLLEPSSPFAKPSDFDKALDSMIAADADTLLGMKEVEVARCFIWPLDEDGKMSLFYKAIKELSGLRRQDQKQEYTMNGAMYIAKMDYFKKTGMLHSMNSIPYIMDSNESIEIDSMFDYELAKYSAENGMIDTSEWK